MTLKQLQAATAVELRARKKAEVIYAEDNEQVGVLVPYEQYMAGKSAVFIIRQQIEDLSIKMEADLRAAKEMISAETTKVLDA